MIFIFVLGFTITAEDASVDPNSLAACVSRNEAFPTAKIPSSPARSCDLVGADQIPSPVPNLDVHKRLTLIGTDSVDFSRTKRRGASLIQPNRGRRDSLVSQRSSSTISSEPIAATPDFKRRPRNALGLRTMITTNDCVPSGNTSQVQPGIFAFLFSFPLF